MVQGKMMGTKSCPARPGFIVVLSPDVPSELAGDRHGA